MKHYASVLVPILLLVLAACGPATQATPTAVAQPTRAPTVATTATPQAVQAATATPTAKPTNTPQASAEPKHGGNLRVRLDTDPPEWGPIKHKGSTGAIRQQHNLVFSMVFMQPNLPDKMCKVGAWVGDAAESWRWVDDRTFEVKIREGIHFTNIPPVSGRELVAEDVAFSHRMSLMDDPIRYVDVVKDGLADIKAVDKYTVRYSTKRPLPALLRSGLANYYGSVILPKEARGPDGVWGDPKVSYIGSGPFMFEEYRPGVKITYKKNPNYFRKGLPYLDSVEFVIMPSQATTTASMIAGKVDLWHRDIPTQVVEDLKRSSPQIQSQECPATAWDGGIWMRPDRPPFDDIRVRRAVAMSIDREGIVKGAYNGKGWNYPIYGGVEPEYIRDLKDIPPETRKYVEYHPDESRRLLAEAGKSGLEFNMNYNASWGLPYSAIMESLVSMFQAVGMKPKTRPLDNTTYIQSYSTCNYDLLYGKTQGEDPYVFLARSHSKYPCPTNPYPNAKHPELDALIDAYETETDPVKAVELSKKVQIAIMDGVWILTLPVRPDYAVLQPYVRNFGKQQTYFSQGWAQNIWLDK